MAAHLEERLQTDIDQIRDKVREMADLALRGLEDAVTSLTTGDTNVAYSAILRDSRIDELESTIDNMCVEFIVRHIPVAAHLRYVHSVAKIISELERVGDYAESINRQAIEVGSLGKKPDLSRFEELARVAIEMVRQATRSFLDGDIELAQRTMELDTKANKLRQEIYRRDLLAAKPQTPEDLAMLFSLLSVANRFERVADQADNICEEVSYILTGEVVKHQLKKDVVVLFVSSANSCRSLMAEGIAKAIAGKHFDFVSAGVDTEAIDQGAVEFLAKRGIVVADHQPKTLEEIGNLQRFRAVVAIGKEAAKAVPRVGYKTIQLEWDVKNPAELGDGGPSKNQAYEDVFNDLLHRITQLIHGLHGTTSASALKRGEH